MAEKQVKPGKLLKKHMIDQIAKRFKTATHMLITDCGKLTNKQSEDLRRRLKKVSSDYLAVKNSMCIKALEKLKIEGLAEHIKSTCGISFGSNDPIAACKVLAEFAKESEKLQLKAAYIDGKIITEDSLKKLALIPSREVLLTKLVMCLNSPVRGMVMALSAINGKFVYALNAIKEQKERAPR
ncbi:MAG: 50S ribosomal protein L10 [Candidatus Omnitrophica bacterium]|nr:50S ribosomal protein L10 [Candidatus Omnitrophota bacterium]